MNQTRAEIAAGIAAERDLTLERLTGLQREFGDITAASVNSNADDEHDPEGSTIAFERSQVSALLLQAQGHLDELAAAESRLAAGTYGQCEACGQPIPTARLQARSVARTCVNCPALAGSLPIRRSP